MKKRLLKKKYKELEREASRLRYQVLHPLVHLDITMHDNRGVSAFDIVYIETEGMPDFFSKQVSLIFDSAVRKVLEGYENNRCAMYASINENLQDKMKSLLDTSANPIKVEVTTSELREILKNADNQRL